LLNIPSKIKLSQLNKSARQRWLKTINTNTHSLKVPLTTLNARKQQKKRTTLDGETADLYVYPRRKGMGQPAV